MLCGRRDGKFLGRAREKLLLTAMLCEIAEDLGLMEQT